METSTFMNKTQPPTGDDLESTLGATWPLWNTIRENVFEKYPGAKEEWNFPGLKHGWSFRIKDKKRAIIYFLPRQGYFKVAFVFGQKATDLILKSDIPDEIKNELTSARVYAEGRGIRIDVKGSGILSAIFKLIEIKIAC
jgi:nucleoside-specific outer membrane channel protein Tsx